MKFVLLSRSESPAIVSPVSTFFCSSSEEQTVKNSFTFLHLNDTRGGLLTYISSDKSLRSVQISLLRYQRSNLRGRKASNRRNSRQKSDPCFGFRAVRPRSSHFMIFLLFLHLLFLHPFFWGRLDSHAFRIRALSNLNKPALFQKSQNRKPLTPLFIILIIRVETSLELRLKCVSNRLEQKQIGARPDNIVLSGG